MDIESRVQKHDDDLYRGNGKPGITTRIAVCEERIEGVKEDLEKLVKGQAWATRLTIATLLGLVTEIIVHIVK